MSIKLYPHQLKAVNELRNGNILRGGVGSGKSLTALAYYDKVARGKDLYIITTARKRDSGDWIKEAARYGLNSIESLYGGKLVIDSWNNVKKYIFVKNAFFIFDEQKVVGYGTWVKSFIAITKMNQWILLSATPGDTWMDYVPVFIANGFYRNKSHFCREHVVYSTRTKFFKVDHYVNTKVLERYRTQITVDMPFNKKTIRHPVLIPVLYNKDATDDAHETRWNPFTDEPMRDVNEYCQVIRKIANTDSSRLLAIQSIMDKHDRLIIFYNYNYELDMLRSFAKDKGIYAYEWNGHKHEAIPQEKKWLYFVQYNAGAEAWNCIETNAIIFYSLNYSYKVMEQVAGRIDRMNTPFINLYYYILISKSPIDKMILRALKNKGTFNERKAIKW